MVILLIFLRVILIISRSIVIIYADTISSMSVYCMFVDHIAGGFPELRAQTSEEGWETRNRGSLRALSVATEAPYPRGSKYPIFKDYGPKHH